MKEDALYHADVEVTIRYHDAVVAQNEFLAADKMRLAVESLFIHLEPSILNVEVLDPKMAPEYEDVVQ